VAIIDKIRAWLIDLVREAIRREAIETASRQNLEAIGITAWELNPTDATIKPRKQTSTSLAKTASKPVTPTVASEPSFERSESEALQAQEKYYEPIQQ